MTVVETKIAETLAEMVEIEGEAHSARYTRLTRAAKRLSAYSHGCGPEAERARAVLQTVYRFQMFGAAGC